MSGPDYWQMAQLESERRESLEALLDKACRARQDGYFTNEDIEDMQREFGLSTHHNTHLKLETF